MRAKFKRKKVKQNPYLRHSMSNALLYCDLCNIGSGELPRLIDISSPKARKAHRCCECWSLILPGESYERIKGLWDEFETYKTCSFCADVRTQAYIDFDLNTAEEGFVFGELWECVGIDYASEI